MAKFTIDGVKQINKYLKGLPKNVARKCVRQAMRPAMKIVQEEAKSNAPVDTGLTRKSIKVRAIKRTSKFIGIDVLIGGMPKGYTGENYYASFIEWGTKNMAPKPFIEPAYQAKKLQAAQFAMTRIRDLALAARSAL